jgi:hypothetical protein
MKGVRPLRKGKELLLTDAAGAVFPLPDDFPGFYQLLAVSGGEPLALFAEFDGYILRPLSMLTHLGLVGL